MNWECPKCGSIHPQEKTVCPCSKGQTEKSTVRANEKAARPESDIVSVEKNMQEAEQPPELSLEFRGSAKDYFRIWIVNLCLTICTLGIFSAWAKVRKKRYLYSHTTLGGTQFQYLGQPIPILKGRLIAAAGFLIYYVSSHFVTFLLPWVLGAGLVVAPWVMVRSAAFNARYSAFRNMTFHFNGGYLDALKILYSWGLIPLFVIAIMFEWQGQAVIIGLISSVFGFCFPFWLRRLKNFIIQHSSYGGKQGDFFATGGQFFNIYFISGLLFLAFSVPLSIAVVMLSSSANIIWIMTYLSPVAIYAGYVLAFAYIRSRSTNLVWNHTRLGPIHFQSTLRCRELLGLYVTNALGIIASLGLLIPWAVIRTLKYRAEKMRVLLQGVLIEFRGSDTSAVGAVGAETIDFFDMDFSI